MPVQITKTTSERYILKSQKPHWWANITITPDGFLDIQSDYGSFSYAWGSFGNDFKAFLMSLDNSYLSCKIGCDHPDEFNAEKTVKAIKRDILEKRRCNDIDSGQARSAWDELKFGINVRENVYHDLPQVLEHIYNSDPSAIPCAMDTSYALTAFIETCWPVFTAELKNELINSSGV